MKPIRLDDEAEAEVLEAASWYSQADPCLGDRFLDEIGRTPDRVQASPEMFLRLERPRLAFPLRRARLRDFPYALVFVELPRRIRIVACAHQKRRPLYWARRLRPPPQA